MRTRVVMLALAALACGNRAFSDDHLVSRDEASARLSAAAESRQADLAAVEGALSSPAATSGQTWSETSSGTSLTSSEIAQSVRSKAATAGGGIPPAAVNSEAIRLDPQHRGAAIEAGHRRGHTHAVPKIDDSCVISCANEGLAGHAPAFRSGNFLALALKSWRTANLISLRAFVEKAGLGAGNFDP